MSADQPNFDEALGIGLLPPVSDRHLALIRWVREFALSKRQYPTQREIGEALGISQTGACQAIDALIKKGYLVKDERTTRRNIRLTALAMKKLESAEQMKLNL